MLAINAQVVLETYMSKLCFPAFAKGFLIGNHPYIMLIEALLKKKYCILMCIFKLSI